MSIIVATNNAGKLAELQTASTIPVVSYTAYLPPVAISETSTTYFGNALKKAGTLAELLQRPVLGDDGGLALGAFPGKLGVHTARFFPPGASDQAKNRQLLELLEQQDDRSFTLHAVLVYCWPDGRKLSAAETLTGVIAPESRGVGGYGFDPILYIPDKKQTLAEMQAAERLALSPRTRAFQALLRRIADVS
ncbi:non-canonical purine NTP pyrophosphatase [Vagococcus acidifermentans]|uniref:Uncharacterized protein n=1 Tax=Vagococcus acidifermentans TaxID=564710 RepID=A0A430AVI2_9ENTE|nr:non-canonical purine NTP pyrophosphatase [Vagococcus acidifermentans]RSU12062.1 hypothetical protein CBF27_06455 [Vagococcus acidifermentans]